MPGTQRRQRDGPPHLPRARAQRRRGLLAARVDRLPERADRADHHADVEEHERRHDRSRGAVEAEPAQPAGRCDQLPERDPDDDRGEHERHHDQGPQQVTAGEAQPVQRERDRDTGQHRDQGRGSRGPQGEPQHPAYARTAEHLEHGSRVEGPLGPEPAREHAGDGIEEEHGERHQRDRGQRQGAQPVAARCSKPEEAHWLVMSRHSRSHSARFSLTSSGSTVSGSGATGAYFSQVFGSGTERSTG